jgi:hypothetical protein
MRSDGTLGYDPGEQAYDLRDQSILASARLGLSADSIAKSWGLPAKRVRQMICDDLAAEIGLQDPRD